MFVIGYQVAPTSYKMACIVKWSLGWLVVAILMIALNSALKQHGTTCYKNEDCLTKMCHPQRKICECYQVNDYATNSKIEQQFNLGVCESKVMTSCTLALIHSDGLPDWKCIRNAKCKYYPHGKGSRQIFGVCECRPGFFASENNTICIPKPEAPTTTATSPATERQTKKSVVHEDELKIEVTRPDSANTSASSKIPAHRSSGDTVSSPLKFEKVAASPTLMPPLSSNGNATFHLPNEFSPIRDGKESTNQEEDVVVVDAIPQRFEPNCTKHAQCQTKFCQGLKPTCSCYDFYDRVLSVTIELYYTNGKCFIKVNQTCLLPSVSGNEETARWNCVNGAICLSTDDENSTTLGLYGRCLCKPEYFSTTNGTECLKTASQTSSGNERVKAFSYMFSLAFNTFVKFLFRQ